MIWAVKWKRLFSALKSFKIGFIGIGLKPQFRLLDCAHRNAHGAI